MTPAVEWEYSLYLAMFPLYFSQLIESLRFHKWSVAIQKPGATLLLNFGTNEHNYTSP